MKSNRHPLSIGRSTLPLANLLLLAGSGTAQGVIEPRHEVNLQDISYWGCDSYLSIDNEIFDVVGDVNDDGYDDLVISDPNSGSGNCGNREGSVAVISGRDASPIWSVGGQVYWGRLGWAVAGAGDVNADGVPDVIACEPFADGGDGRVWVYSGSTGAVLHSLPNPDPNLFYNAESVSGIADLDGDGSADFIVGFPSGNANGARVFVYSGASGALLYTLLPPYPDLFDADLFGYAVADAGDATGDGIHDILVGEPNARNAQGQVTGAVYLFSGATGSLVFAIWGVPSGGFGHQVDGVGDQDGDGKADFIVAGDQGIWSRVFSGSNGALLWSGFYASTASGAGDVNGDGIQDFLVGYPNYLHGAMVTVVAGGTFATLYAFRDQNMIGFGTALSRAGDINGDGFGDFMVGYGSIDRVFVYLGRPAPSEIRRIDGDAAGDKLGHAVSGAGDVDNDGYDDVIVGAPYDDTAAGTDAGSARVLSGFDGSEILACTGAAGDQLGASVSGAGDVNRDGFDDVIIGARYDDTAGTNAGAARVLSGKNGSALFTFYGSAAEDYFGSVSDAGDVNRDGFADVIVGGPWRDHAGLTDAGAATVYSGRNGSVLLEWFGAAAGDLFGYSVSGAGDVDGDGRDDVIVGAYASDVNGSASGSATVFSGFNGAVLFSHHGDAVNDWFGFSVSSAGDVNKDGFADVIVGSQEGVNHNVGKAHVFAGASGTLLYEFAGLGSQYYFGYSVSGAGDVNGDGYDDVIVGAHGSTVSGIGQPGVARVHSGFDGGVLLYQFPGDEDNAAFGISVSGAGDVNGDGRDDVIVGARMRDAGGLADSGSAFIYSLGYPGDRQKRQRRDGVH